MEMNRGGNGRRWRTEFWKNNWQQAVILIGLAASCLVPSAHASTVILVTKAANGVDLVITIAGTPTYTVYRAPVGDFTFDTETLVDTLPGSSYTDVAAIRAAAPVYFYDTVAVGESSPATASGGNPQPNITITSLTPNAGKDADSIVIAGATFAQFYGENLVSFNGKPAPVTAVGSGTITVSVPPGATSGPVQVRVGRLVSNALPFTVAPKTGFLNLTGINVNPANYHVFVTDTGQGSSASLIELDPFSSWASTTRGGAGNIRGFPYGPVGNRFYYSNGSKSDFNAGQIRYWDLSTNVQGSYSNTAGTAGVGADPVACVAMGVSLVSNNFFFFADKRNGQIRRVNDVSGHSTFASGFAFPDSDYDATNVAGYAGLAFDSNGTSGTTNYGDLFATQGDNYLYRVHQNNPLSVPDDTTVASLTGGLNLAAGLYFDHFLGSAEYHTRTLFIANRGGNSISLYHVPTSTLEVPPRLSGLNAPRMATLGQTNDSPPETRTYIAEPTRVVAADDLRIEVSPKDNIRVLISNCPLGNVTPGCVGVPFPSQNQTQSRLVTVTATVHPPRPGVTIYFDVEDPPDTAPYIASPPPNDNAGGAGSLSVASATTDVTGHATVVLTVTDQFAGDNYRVRARFSSAGAVVAKTGIITAWKRVFVEQDKMFRQPGQYLTADVTAGGTSTIAVGDSSRFVSGDLVYVFDSVNDVPEVATIQSKTTTSLTFNNGIGGPYLMANGAYVGRAADGFYDSDMSTFYSAYDQGFTEFVYRPKGSNLLPNALSTELDSAAERTAFSKRWFKNGAATTNLSNYVQILAVEDVGAGLTGYTDYDNNFSYTAILTIQNDCSALGCSAAQLTNYIRHNSIHEVGHQFYISNAPLSTASWCSAFFCPGDFTLMASNTERRDAIEEFWDAELAAPSPSIRRTQDPL